ncbi:MAG: hypothetical protein DGJ47_000170 [Rickettsiaceae bacterium]
MSGQSSEIKLSLVTAIENDDIIQFNDILENNNINTQIMFQYLLAVASGYKKTEFIKNIMSRHSFSKETMVHKNNILNIAAQQDDTELLQKILELKIDINSVGLQGNTPLHIAAQYGNNNSITLLLDNGAKTYKKNCDGNTPLHIAALKHHKDVLKLLLDFEPCQSGCFSFFKSFFNYAPANIKNKEGDTIIHLLIKKDYWSNKDLVISILDNYYFFDSINNELGGVLHYATVNNDVEFIEDINKLGVDLNKPNAVGNTPLHIAAADGKLFEAFKCLIRAGANKHVWNYNNQLPIDCATDKAAQILNAENPRQCITDNFCESDDLYVSFGGQECEINLGLLGS